MVHQSGTEIIEGSGKSYLPNAKGDPHTKRSSMTFMTLHLGLMFASVIFSLWADAKDNTQQNLSLNKLGGYPREARAFCSLYEEALTCNSNPNCYWTGIYCAEKNRD